jgi:pimeloyl-ACP methyl ester carboxylesterase
VRLLSFSPQAAAAHELERAQALEAGSEEESVDAYFLACSLAWQSLPTMPQQSPPGKSFQCYNAAVAGLLRTAQRFGRLDPACRLRVWDGGRAVDVPVVHHSFPWQAGDFQRLHPPPHGHEPLLSRRYACDGAGVPLVVERVRNGCLPVEARFFPEKSLFPATAVVRFDAPAAAPAAEAAVVEFYNPLALRGLSVQEAELPLAVDLTASLAKTLEEAPRSYLAGFIEPGGATTAPRLNFLEPYQPGKVPVVLIHGLFSDPQSWADLVNDLRAAPGFVQRHQLWIFRYPTGQGFLQSAAELRREVRAALGELDSACCDRALRRAVLIGHSMGGLIAKLQVTYSDELVWSQLANRPLEEIVTSEETRAHLAEVCYFDPSPNVARVIFIAAPHCGSLPSSACVGEAASLLVEPSHQLAALHEQLIRDNPQTFNPLIERRFPTSIDMLTPRSPLLDAMRHMRLRPGVKLHNIIGVSHPLSLEGPSDGVVSAASATHPHCHSTLAVGAPHAKVHRTFETTAEVLRILGCQATTP